jgi:hypothetical protein
MEGEKGLEGERGDSRIHLHASVLTLRKIIIRGFLDLRIRKPGRKPG